MPLPKCCFLDFFAQDNSSSPSGSAFPASEDALIRFCSHFADTLHHSSIKVYLSARVVGYQTSPRLKQASAWNGMGAHGWVAGICQS